MIKVTKTNSDLREDHLGWACDIAWIYSGRSLEFWGAYCFFKRWFVHRVLNSTMWFIPQFSCRREKDFLENSLFLFGIGNWIVMCPLVAFVIVSNIAFGYGGY